MCELTKPWYNSVGHKTKQNYMNVRNTFVRKSKAGAEGKAKERDLLEEGNRTPAE